MAESLEVAEVRERLRYDWPFWAEHCATVLNEDRIPVKLKPRPWQARTPETPAHITPIDEALERQRRAGKPMRLIIPKARKLGCSTAVQSKMMQRVTQLPFQYALTVAHLRSAAGVLADMAMLMYQRLPTEEQLGLGFSIRPQLLGKGTTRNGSRFMTFGDRHRPHEASIYETLTAGARGGGRAMTPSMIHGSEVAHYEDEDYLAGMLSSLPLRPETMCVLESTPNGFNHFHTMCMNALEGKADPETGSVWDLIFFGWQDNPYNTLPFISEQARDRFERTIGDPDGGGDEEEEWLVEEFGVGLEQLNWRRAVLHGPEFNSKVEMFHQEHAATLEQAFIGSGSPVFSGILVSKAIKAAETAHEPVQGYLRGGNWRERRTRSGTVRVPQTVSWVAREDATPVDFDAWGSQERLLVWEHPVNAETQQGMAPHERKPDGQYIVFVDVAEGVGGTLEARDYSVIQVLDHITRMQVARWRSRIDIHDLPVLALMTALYYNEAWLAVEKTGLGIGVVDTLQKDYHYRRMYRTHRPGDDELGDAAGRQIGWSTDRRTKPLMEMAFGQALKDETHGLRDVQTAREISTYVEDPKNRAKHGAKKGSFDDLLMAFMGAHRVADELKPRAPGKKRSGPRRIVADDVTGW